MNRDLMFSSKNNAWCTPQDFFDKLDGEFQFTLDPCATSVSAKCNKFFTVDEDGLKQDWSKDRVFVNPPYGREIGKWVKKSYESSLGGALVVMLIPSRTDTRWWHDYIQDKAEVRFVKGRLKFVNLDSPEPRKMSSAPFPSAIIIYQTN
jgi:site-specific DNA-methyltransferase (adenine-specific)